MSLKSRISWCPLLGAPASRRKNSCRSFICAIAALLCLRAGADPILTVSDGVNTGTITLTNGSGTYVNEDFSGAWSVVVTAAQSKPAIGSAVSPNMELDIVATSLGAFNPLTITLTDNNFGPTYGNNNIVAQLIGQPFGGFGDVLTFDTYVDTNNTLGAPTSLLTTCGD